MSSRESLVQTHPKVARQWHPIRNKDLQARDVKPFSNKKVWWLCERGHEWEAIVFNRSNGRGCPFCSGRRATDYYNLEVVNPSLADEWHPSKNGNVSPRSVTPFSHKKVWWHCGLGHEWEARVIDRTNGSGCPFCLGRQATDNYNLQVVNPSLAEEWHQIKNGTLFASDVTPFSNKEVWWRCRRGHEWETRVSNRTSGRGCPFCSGRYATADYNLRAANRTLAREWDLSKNGNVTPADVTPFSNKKVWWRCESGHEWQARVADRSNGSGCPYCSIRKGSA